MARQWRRNGDLSNTGNYRHGVNLSQHSVALAVKHSAPRSSSHAVNPLSHCYEIPLQLRTVSVDKAVHNSVGFEKFSRGTFF